MKIKRLNQSDYKGLLTSEKLKKSFEKKYNIKLKEHSRTPTFDELSPAWIAGEEKYCVMFSGGFDSLSLTLRHLEKGEKVALIHLSFNRNEDIACTYINKILKKLYPKNFLGTYSLFDSIQFTGCESMFGLNQQPMTVYAAAFISEHLRQNCKAIECAYIMNDDAISFEKELKSIYSNTEKLKSIGNHCKSIPLKFPLKQTKHYENVNFIKGIEKKYNVTFPCGSTDFSEFTSWDFEEKGMTKTLSYYYCSNDSQKDNKEHEVLGYVILEDTITDF